MSIDPERLPKHVAVIMDGNGRWAQRRLLPRIEGHRAGGKSVRAIVEECRRLGIRYLTLFAFSTENWNRPVDEVSSLMRIFVQYLDSELEVLLRNGIRLRAMGDLARLPESVRAVLDRNMERTREMDGLDLILAVSYGGRDEIVAAARAIATAVQAGHLGLDDITTDAIARNLYLPDVPDPDLLIRTSDESRVSNFMLWQLAYAEIVVTPTLWPDFSRAEFARCLETFAGRRRRFGLTEEQVRGEALTR